MTTHNRFSQDTLDDRAFRLERIESNLAGYAVALTLPTELATWGATCSTNYLAARTLYLVENSESEEATMILLQKIAFMEDEYQIARKFAYTQYESQPQRLLGLKFDKPFPTSQQDKIERVFHVVNKHARLVSSGVTPILPPALITRLETAATDARATMTTRNLETEQSDDASEAFKVLWSNDTTIIAKLLSWCQMTWGIDGVNLNNLAFARSSQLGHGGGGPVPSAPSGLQLSGETLTWTAVVNATSYGISLSYDVGTHWEGDFNSDTNSSVVPVAEVGKLYYRVRARNANGYGEYSGTFEHLFGLSAVDNFAYDSDQFTWNPVEFANGYDIQYSLANEENWVLIFNGNATSFAHTPASGSWTYRIRASYGSIKSEWVEIAVEQV